MTWSPITIRRWTSETGKTGWRWQCRLCPPIRPGPDGTGGRPHGGFHWDDRFVIARVLTHPGAWETCKRAALLHVHVYHHAGVDPHPVDDTVTCHEETRNP